MLQFTVDETHSERLDENRIAALIADGSGSFSVEVAEVAIGK